MIVLVCGGRAFTDKYYVYNILDYINHSRSPIDRLIHGAATGVDTLAMLWAVNRKIKQTPFSAKWKQYGKAAGSIRNQQMLDEGKPDLVVAFPGGVGTADMVNRARKQGTEIIMV